jgi:hypothetical protein
MFPAIWRRRAIDNRIFLAVNANWRRRLKPEFELGATKHRERPMTGGLAARIRIHQENIERYIALLEAAKTPSEKEEIERRIEEEHEAIEALGATGVSAFPGPHSLL